MSAALATDEAPEEVRVRLPFEPRWYQQAAHFAFALVRFAIFVWHRRAGKTVFALVELVLDATAFEAPQEGLARPGRFAYICPLLKQAKDVAWPYLRQLAGAIPGTEIREGELAVVLPNGSSIRLYGADHPDALRGGYLDGVVLDEVGQMKRAIWFEVIRPMLADRNGWALFIGTPKGINLFSELLQSATGNPEWLVDVRTCDDTQALDPEEIAAAQRDMPPHLFAQEFKCDFHAAVADRLIKHDVVDAAAKRVVRPEAIEWAPRILGVDVARFGDDHSAIAKRQGRVAFPISKHHGLDTMALAGRVANVAQEWAALMTFVDVTGGLGAGVFDRLRQLGIKCMPVDFGASPNNARYRNKRSEIWGDMGEWLKDASIPADDLELQQDLTAPTYDFDGANRLVLESKDDIRERLGRSPDKGDALACTFAEHVVPLADRVGGGRPGRAKTDYDPYQERH